MNNTIVYHQNCYVINELRNLAIETIQTSHFILVDGDGLISCNYFAEALPLATMEDNLKSYISLLSNEKEVLLFPLYPFNSGYNRVCRYKGQCKEAYYLISLMLFRWDRAPKTKQDLILSKGNNQERPSYVVHWTIDR